MIPEEEEEAKKEGLELTEAPKLVSNLKGRTSLKFEKPTFVRNRISIRNNVKDNTKNV